MMYMFPFIFDCLQTIQEKNINANHSHSWKKHRTTATTLRCNLAICASGWCSDVEVNPKAHISLIDRFFYNYRFWFSMTLSDRLSTK